MQLRAGVSVVGVRDRIRRNDHSIKHKKARGEAGRWFVWTWLGGARLLTTCAPPRWPRHTSAAASVSWPCISSPRASSTPPLAPSTSDALTRRQHGSDRRQLVRVHLRRDQRADGADQPGLLHQPVAEHPAWGAGLRRTAGPAEV